MTTIIVAELKVPLKGKHILWTKEIKRPRADWQRHFIRVACNHQRWLPQFASKIDALLTLEACAGAQTAKERHQWQVQLKSAVSESSPTLEASHRWSLLSLVVWPTQEGVKTVQQNQLMQGYLRPNLALLLQPLCVKNTVKVVGAEQISRVSSDSFKVDPFRFSRVPLKWPSSKPWCHRLEFWSAIATVTCTRSVQEPLLLIYQVSGRFQRTWQRKPITCTFH